MILFSPRFISIMIASNICGILLLRGLLRIGEQILHIFTSESIDRFQVVYGFRDLGAFFVFITILCILFYFSFMYESPANQQV